MKNEILCTLYSEILPTNQEGEQAVMIQPKHLKSPQLVLIVDDQEINREVLGMMLKDYYELIYACDGKEAVQKIEEYAFGGCNNATLYVPHGLVSTYRSTADWSRIKKIEEIEIPSLALSCNNKGKVKINGVTEFTNDMGEVDVNYGVDNTFIFQPNENCQLEQVLIDGLDVTLSVKNNQLTTKIHEGSKMIVTFSKSSGDMNGDGMVNISDVVALVNLILGQ